MWMWFGIFLATSGAQPLQEPAWTPSIEDAKALANTCTGPRSCPIVCWDSAVQLLEPTTQGGVRRACYTKGESHGPIVSWHPNGRKEGVGYSKHGVPEGGYVAWHTNGKPAATGSWRAGKRDGWLTTWHSNGQMRSQGEWKNGNQRGMVRHWYDDGQLEEVSHWSNTGPEGPLFLWHPDGQPKSRGRYKSGLPHGMWKQWYANGRREVYGRYQRGIATFIRCWGKNGKQTVCPASTDPKSNATNSVQSQ